MNTVSIIVLIVLAVLTIVQVMRISEISSSIQGGKDNQVSEKDNDTQGKLLLLVGMGFVISVLVMYWAWGYHSLPAPSSEHGSEIDSLWNLSMLIINVVFFIVQPILFYFGYKYRGKKGTKAVYYEHNNKLELFWTVVPALFLAVLIIWGLNVWSGLMMPENEEEPIVIELYAQQFNWTARYSGGDNQLGYATVHEIAGANIVGVDTKDAYSSDDSERTLKNDRDFETEYSTDSECAGVIKVDKYGAPVPRYVRDPKTGKVLPDRDDHPIIKRKPKQKEQSDQEIEYSIDSDGEVKLDKYGQKVPKYVRNPKTGEIKRDKQG